MTAPLPVVDAAAVLLCGDEFVGDDFRIDSPVERSPSPATPPSPLIESPPPSDGVCVELFDDGQGAMHPIPR